MEIEHYICQVIYKSLQKVFDNTQRRELDGQLFSKISLGGKDTQKIELLPSKTMETISKNLQNYLSPNFKIANSADIYLFKVNYRKSCHWHCSGVAIVHFEHISHLSYFYCWFWTSKCWQKDIYWKQYLGAEALPNR